MANMRGIGLDVANPLDLLNNLSFTNFTINSGGGSIDRLAWVLQMPPDLTDTLTHLCFRYGARTGTPVAHDIGLQGFTASMLPDGTWKGGGSPNKGSFTPPADTTWDSTWREIALDNAYTFARGELLCIVVEPTGTPDGANNSSFSRTPTGSAAYLLPNCATQTDGAAWTLSNSFPCVAAKSATRVYGLPLSAVFATNIGTNGHRQVNKITIPSGAATTIQVVGLYGRITASGASSVIFGIWDSSGAVVTAITIDSDLIATTGPFRVRFDDAPVTLNTGTAYYFGIERVGAAVRLAGFDVNAAADMAPWPLGASCIASTWDTSTWTDVATRRFIVSPILEDMTAVSAGGGNPIGLGGAVIRAA